MVTVIQVPKQNVSEYHVSNFCIMHFSVTKTNKEKLQKIYKAITLLYDESRIRKHA